MATHTLTVSGSAKWSTASWDSTPAAGDSVVLIGQTGAGGTLTLDINTPTLGALVIGTSGKTMVLAVGAQTLAVDNSGTSSTDLINVGSLGTITLSGGTIDAGGISLAASGAVLSGYGTVAILSDGSATHTISGSGTITASGGTLALNGTVSSGPVFTIGTASVSTLLFNGSATTASAIAINNVNQTLAVGSTGTLTIGAAENINNGAIALGGGTLADSSGVTIGNGARLTGYGTVSGVLTVSSTGLITVSGGVLTDSSGIVLSGGTLTGTGTLAANTNVSGTGTISLPVSTAGTITASNGLLDLTGAVSSRSLVISSAANSTLEINSVVSADTIAITTNKQFLTIGTGGTLTLSSAESITTGLITMAGGSLADSAGLTLGASSHLTGYGTVSADIAVGTGTITAAGGTLDITGNSASGVSYVISTTNGSVLQFDGTATVSSAFAMSNAGQTLRIGATGNVTFAATEAITQGTIAMAGGTLADAVAAGITIGNTATLIGYGTVTANLGVGTNQGTILASGGTLALTGSISSTNVNIFQIGTASASTLLFSNASTAKSATAIAISNANQTLAVGNATTLTIGAAESITAGTILMAGGTLADSSGITLGASSHLTGSGAVTANLAAGTGTVTASGGTLALFGTVASGDTLAIDSATPSMLQIDGTATAASAISITAANQTLAIGSTGALTISATESITNGTISMLGGALTDTSGVTIGTGAQMTGYGTVSGTITAAGLVSVSGGTLADTSGIVLTGGTLAGTGTLSSTTNVSGYGTISLPVSTAGSITASGGLLDLTGATSNRTLVINSGTASTLKVDAVVSSGAIAISSANQTLAVGAAGTLTIGAAESITAGTISMLGGTLADSSGITLGAGSKLTGSGMVTANLAAGTGTVTASGGTLALFGTVASGDTLAIDSTTPSVLQIDGTATAASAISITAANQTLAIGSTGALTINGTESLTNGTISMAGGTLADSSGVTLGAGSKLTGSGTVTATLSGTGTVIASSGTLNLTANIAASSGLTFDIANSATSILKLSGNVGSGNTVTFAGTQGALELNDVTVTAGGLNFSGTVDNLGTASVDTSVSGINYIDVQGTVTNVVFVDSTHIAVYDGTVDLGTITLGSAVNTSTTHVDWISDTTLGGTDIFLSTVNCFAAGTHILTPAGERTVESLVAGEEVLTLSDEDQIARPIHWVGHRHIDLTAHPEPRLVAPVRVRQGAFAENTPSADLLLSPDHAVLVDGRLIAIRQLINGATIRQETDWTAVDYYHLELDRHAILITEGMPSESYLDTGNRGFFANSGDPMTLHPDLMDEADNASRAAISCMPFAWDEATVRPIWQGLAERAVALGEALPKIETTTEADLHLLIKGRSQRPLYAENGLYIFALRRGVTEARLASRASAPTDARPWLDDRRTLGVAVERIVLRTADDVRDIPLDAPGLTQGWWGVESDGTALRRWTDGNAMLPLPGAAGPTILEVRVCGTIAYRVGADRPRQVA